MMIEKVLIVDPVDGEYSGKVEIQSGRIVNVETCSEKPEAILMPGFIDIHTHGAKGVDFLEDEDWESAVLLFYRNGVTTFFPTSVSAPIEKLTAFLKRVDKESKRFRNIGGAHLEGPFISPEEKGAQNEQYIRPPEIPDIETLTSFEVFKTITLAPEACSPETMELLLQKGVVISAGHSNATYEETVKAFQVGVSRITHFPNALRVLHHREVGIMGAALLHPVHLELISDGVHVSPEMINLTVKIKGCDRIILITDSISAAGLEDGEYRLHGKRVIVKEGIARLEDGTLAGSTLQYSVAVKNFQKFTGCSLKDLAKVSSYNAAQNLKLDRKGRISIGMDADLVVLDFELNILEVYKEGERVWGGEPL